MRGIFISYRREDSEGQAGRLFDDLVAHFGRDAVFMDVANIKKGQDFRRSIEEQVASCGVLLVMIGKHWLEAADAAGRSRLADANDFVRLETAAALAREIPVIPVLVQGATMPREQDLPDALKPLAFRNNTELTHARWESDVKLLIDDLAPHVEGGTARPTGGGGKKTPRTGWVVGIVVAIAAAIGVFGLAKSGSRPAPPIASGGPAAPMHDAATDTISTADAKPHGTACLPGFEWRLATTEDHVCVTPAARRQVAEDNAQAGSRRAGGGAYGDQTCKVGYVWREARPGDSVCVTPDIRLAVTRDNALASNRIARVGAVKP